MSRRQAAGKVKWMRGKDGRKRPTLVSKGAIDFNEVKARLRNKVALRGAGADEAPEAYKNLEEVLSHQGETIEVLHRLRPIGVAMAGEDIVDPYKD